MAQHGARYIPTTAAASWRRLLLFLVAAELLLVGAYLVTWTQVAGEQMAIWFDLDREPGLGAWFSSSQLLVIALVLGQAPSRPGRDAEPSLWFLRLLALGFLFLSMDEAIAIHEAISLIVRKRLPEVQLAWIPLYGAVALVVTAATAFQMRRVWRTSRESALLSLLGGATYVTGAVVLEVVATVYRQQHLRWEIAAEEFAEMSGASLLLCGALSLTAKLRQEGVRAPLVAVDAEPRKVA
jgi:hypothetical protein